jgi:hypothetical protein
MVVGGNNVCTQNKIERIEEMTEKLKVEFYTSLPVDAKPSEIKEWLMFQFGQGSVHCSNPLFDYDIEPMPGTIKFSDES